MKAKTLGCLVAGLLLWAGCVPTVNPVYRSQDLVFDPSVIGVWRQADVSSKWEVSQRDAHSYSVRYTDENGQKGRFIACLANVRGTRFLDLFPEEPSAPANALYKMHLVPIHTVYLVRSTQPKLELAAIDGDWLKKYLTEHPESLPHVAVKGGQLITASTEKLQDFLIEHQSEFTGAIELVRVEASK